jgi:uncharacterized protein YndB with AHSA1/START domain
VSVIEASIEIDAPVHLVWEVVADPRNLPLWDHRVLDVSGFPAGGLRPGSQYRVEMGFMGVHAWVPATVLELVPDACSRVHLGGLVDAVVDTRLEPVSSHRTRLTHRIDYRFLGGRLGSFAAGAINMLGAPTLLRKGMHQQKRQVEANVARDEAGPEA